MTKTREVSNAVTALLDCIEENNLRLSVLEAGIALITTHLMVLHETGASEDEIADAINKTFSAIILSHASTSAKNLPPEAIN